MSQRPTGLRESMQIVRRSRRLLGAFAIIGVLGGCAYVVISPPKMTSEAVIVVPATTPLAMATEVVVAGSDPVLLGASAKLGPSESLEDLRNQVRVTSLTTSLIQVMAFSTRAASAENIANAVAASFISYVGGSASPIGQVRGQVFESATMANGAGLPGRLLIFGLIGIFGGELAGFVVVVARNRSDKKLRQRDEIANSIGVPVLAAIPVSHPSDSSGWTSLLNGYEPGAVDAWRLRRVLSWLRVTDTAKDESGATGSSLTVLSLTSDPTALALGPQLAAFAASIGIRTVLAVGPQPDASATASLHAACAAASDESLTRKHPFQLAVVEDGALESGFDKAAFVVVVAVVNHQSPHMPAGLPTTATVLAVTAGAITAEEMAKAASTAAADGREVVGILVADPDPTDQTSGSVPQLGRSAISRTVPTRSSVTPTETRW